MIKKKEHPAFEGVLITDAGVDGKGVGRTPEGLVIWVEKAVPGDVVDVQVLYKKKKFYFGKISRLITPSPHRVQPFCIHFDLCGGCSWQQIDYNFQLELKTRMVKNALERIGKLDMPEMLTAIPSPETRYYRNRLDFAFSNNRWITSDEIATGKKFEHRNALGFHIPGRFDKVFDVVHCHLQPEPSNTIRNSFREFALENNLPFYQIKEKKGLLRSLIIKTALTNEVMVMMMFGENEPENIKKVMDFFADKFPEISSLYFLVNTKSNETIFDQELILYKGKELFTEVINGISYNSGPKSFFQTNSHQSSNLFKLALKVADFRGDEKVYDLYTGVGTIALAVAGHVKHVTGVESIPEAIEMAKLNAAENGIKNLSFFAGNVEDVFTAEFAAKHGAPDIIITDPPRAGMHPKAVKTVLNLQPEKILYISCNAATQARDIAEWKDHYSVEHVQAVDMFPHTTHCENIVLLKRNA